MLRHKIFQSIISQTIAEERLPPEFAVSAETWFIPLCDHIVERHQRLKRPLIVGINGAQGTGKSTLALLLERLLQAQHFRCVVLSIDDFYFTRDEREDLATTVHPLLQTRGVPGTHDLSMMLDTISQLIAAQNGSQITIPHFDKALDDRSPPECWNVYEGPVDVIVIEGWCVGAQPAPLSGDPMNALEQLHDPDGSWRRFIEEQLLEYQHLFSQLDLLVMLKAPSMRCIIEWRTLQEKKLRERLEQSAANSSSNNGSDLDKRFMGENELLWFIMHYERLTRSMLEHMPEYADVVLELNAEHRIVATLYKEQKQLE